MLLRKEPLSPSSLDSLRERHGERYKWLVLWTVMVGQMASVLSTTIVNVAVPDMSRYFAIGQGRAQWISAAFMIAMTLSLPLTPWLLQRYGLRRTYAGATLLLMAGGIIGGLSGNFSVMIAMRVVEGIAAGLLQPIPNVVILRGFGANEQGRAMGLFGFGVVLVPAIGPTVGGVLVEHFGWRSVFFVVVPFCLAALFLTRRFLPAISSFATGERRPLDWIGLIWLSMATLCLLNGLVGLSGPDIAPALALLLFGAVNIAGFAWYQLRRPYPLLHLRLFGYRQFAVGALVCFVYGVGLFGSTYLFPVFMQSALAYSPSQAGLVLLPAGLALAVAMPIAGRLADRLPATYLVAGGLALLAISLWLTASIGMASAFLTLIAWAILGRIGLALVLPALSLGLARGLSSEEIPQAASVSSFARQLGGAIGVSLVGVVLEWRLAAYGVELAHAGTDSGGRLAAFQECFVMLGAIAAVAAGAALFMRSQGRGERVRS